MFTFYLLFKKALPYSILSTYQESESYKNPNLARDPKAVKTTTTTSWEAKSTWKQNAYSFFFLGNRRYITNGPESHHKWISIATRALAAHRFELRKDEISTTSPKPLTVLLFLRQTQNQRVLATVKQYPEFDCNLVGQWGIDNDIYIYRD